MQASKSFVANRWSPLQCIVPPHIFSAMLKSGEFGADEMIEDVSASAAIRGVRTHRRASANGSPVPECLVHTARNEQTLPGFRIDDPATSQDEAARDVLAFLRSTLDFFKSLGRNSIDDQGMDVVATVHFGKRFPNAFWNGGQLVFGDGTSFFNRFTTLDIVAHELCHGVIQHTNDGLEYESQSGALNESFADVFAIAIKHRALQIQIGNARPQDWLIGRGLFLSSDMLPDTRFGIRSIAAPGSAYADHRIVGTDPQVAHLDDFEVIQEDHGGVHIFSGIPNRAFFLVARELNESTWERPAKIWYEALKRLPKRATFKDMAAASIDAAQNVGDGRTRDIVEQAWKEVGVEIAPPVSVTVAQPGDLAGASVSAKTPATLPAEATKSLEDRLRDVETQLAQLTQAVELLSQRVAQLTAEPPANSPPKRRRRKSAER